VILTTKTLTCGRFPVIPSLLCYLADSYCFQFSCLRTANPPRRGDLTRNPTCLLSSEAVGGFSLRALSLKISQISSFILFSSLYVCRFFCVCHENSKNVEIVEVKIKNLLMKTVFGGEFSRQRVRGCAICTTLETTFTINSFGERTVDSLATSPDLMNY
jgi:hypothetical protein